MVDPLSDIRSVGPGKPVGYLPLSTIKTYRGDIKLLTKEAKQGGLMVRVFNENETNIGSGALYVAHKKTLMRLLEQNKNILKHFGWSSNPAKFIEDLATKVAPRKTKLFDVVADAFVDYVNQGRTDAVEQPEPNHSAI
jgi:hypothetical protein